MARSHLVTNKGRMCVAWHSSVISPSRDISVKPGVSPSERQLWEAVWLRPCAAGEGRSDDVESLRGHRPGVNSLVASVLEVEKLVKAYIF